MGANVGVVGVGRKPKPFNQREKRQVRDLQPVTPDERLLVPPGELTAKEAQIWADQAPHALHELTLTPETAGAFGQLCRLWAAANDLHEKIQQLGAANPDAARLVDTWLKVVHRVDQAQARFRLTAFAKPQLERKPKNQPNNPFAAFSTHGETARTA